MKDRLRAKLDLKKQQEYELKMSNENSNHLIYRPMDGERAEMSTIKEAEYDVDAIVASIAAVGEQPSNPNTSNQKKKNKKKK
jgi:hypothetical protein